MDRAPPEEMTVGIDTLTQDEARRSALAAQGFATPRPTGRVDARRVRRVVDRLGVLQIDSISVLCRAHYLPLFARLGAYPRAALDRIAWGPAGRGMFEYWAHKASLVPIAAYPLWRWRMRATEHARWQDGYAALDRDMQRMPSAMVGGMHEVLTNRPELPAKVLSAVTERGPVTASELGADDPGRKSITTRGPQVEWQSTKVVLEWLLHSGRLMVSGRVPTTFERRYDLTERVVPADVLAAPEPDEPEAQRELGRIAARRLGVATAREIIGQHGYFQLAPKTARQRVAELVESGDLTRVRVDGVKEPMYAAPDAIASGPVEARALLSPFDPLMWNRDRVLRLFGFHYRIGIYLPEKQRPHGYYVLPFLLGDRLVARVDLKADRANSALLVPQAHTEDGVAAGAVAGELAAELRQLAEWLALERVVVGERGDLAPALERAVRAAG